MLKIINNIPIYSSIHDRHSPVVKSFWTLLSWFIAVGIFRVSVLRLCWYWHHWRCPQLLMKETFETKIIFLDHNRIARKNTYNCKNQFVYYYMGQLNLTYCFCCHCRIVCNQNYKCWLKHLIMFVKSVLTPSRLSCEI